MRYEKKTFDRRGIPTPKIDDKDKLLAEIAQLIVWAYNGACKPNPLPKELPAPYYKWKHGTLGYSLLSSETENFSSPTVLTIDEHICDFVEHIFLVLAGETSVKWNKVYRSDAVSYALERFFDVKVELSNIGPDHKTDRMGIPIPPARPTIWIDEQTIDDKSKEKLKGMGFERYTKADRPMWALEL